MRRRRRIRFVGRVAVSWWCWSACCSPASWVADLRSSSPPWWAVPVSALLSVRSLDAAAAVCVLGAAGPAPPPLGAGLVSCPWACVCAGCVWGVVCARCSGPQRRGAGARLTAAGGVCGSGDRRLPPAHD